MMRALCRGSRRSSRRAAYSPPNPPPAITTSKATGRGYPAASRAASRAGRMRRGRRRETRQGAPAKAWFATVAKPSSSTRSASSRCAIRSDGGSSRSTARNAEAVHAPAPGRHEQRAALAEQPDAELAALEGEPGLALELALVVAEQVAEQPLRHGLSRRGPRLLRPHDARPPERVQLGDDPGVRERGERHRRGERLEPDHPHAGADERHRVEQRPGMPDPSPAAQPARIGRLAPRDRGELG